MASLSCQRASAVIESLPQSRICSKKISPDAFCPLIAKLHVSMLRLVLADEPLAYRSATQTVRWRPSPVVAERLSLPEMSGISSAVVLR